MHGLRMFERDEEPFRFVSVGATQPDLSDNLMLPSDVPLPQRDMLTCQSEVLLYHIDVHVAVPPRQSFSKPLKSRSSRPQLPVEMLYAVSIVANRICRR
jgi:hypothetical protein